MTILWDHIVLPKWQIKSIKNTKEKDCVGLDTETLDGYTKLITDSKSHYAYISKIDDILEFLFQMRYRKSHNFFYNIRYDTESILKYLPVKNLIEIIAKNRTVYHDYTITIIPKKILSISKHQNKVSFYDLAQYYNSSLESASNKYLNQHKLKDDLDVKKIGGSKKYWEQNREKILSYCIQDSILTEQLATYLQNCLITDIQMTPQSYVSKAGISKLYFRNRCDIPDIRKIPKIALKYAFESYHGGRFENVQRGHFSHVSLYDVHSGYPSYITDLYDVSHGDWKHVDEMHEKATYGYYLADVDIMPSNICLLAYSSGNRILYPSGTWRGTFTKTELETLPDYDSYDILDGVEFFRRDDTQPFKKEILNLYSLKAKAEKRSMKYSLYKIIMNAFYGVQYEKHSIGDGKYQAGMFFNPIYATQITAALRVNLWKNALKHPKRVIAFATDSIAFNGHVKLPTGNTLGAFGLEKQGEGFFIKSGIYSVEDKKARRGITGKSIIKFKGNEYSDIVDYLRKCPDQSVYPFEEERPLHISECLISKQKYTKKDINIFTKQIRHVDLNTEYKRIYKNNNICGRDILTKKFNSKVVNIDMLK